MYKIGYIGNFKTVPQVVEHIINNDIDNLEKEYNNGWDINQKIVLSEYADIPTKETVKYLQFETFEYDVLSDCEKRRNIIIFDNKYNRRIRVCKDLKQ